MNACPSFLHCFKFIEMGANQILDHIFVLFAQMFNCRLYYHYVCSKSNDGLFGTKFAQNSFTKSSSWLMRSADLFCPPSPSTVSANKSPVVTVTTAKPPI